MTDDFCVHPSGSGAHSGSKAKPKDPWPGAKRGEQPVKRRIFQCLTILGINLVVGFLAGLSALLLLSKGDPILAAVPAVVALPAMLLQPWFLVFFLFMPAGPVLSPFLTTAITVPTYVLLDRKGKLNRLKLVISRLKNRRTHIIAGSFILCALAVSVARYVDFPALHRGTPKTLQYAIKDTLLASGNPRYYCLNSFIDSEWLWQVTLSEDDLDLLADTLGLSAMPADRIGDRYRNMPPYWWRPVISDQVRVLATPDFPMANRGPDGWHALATWNPADQRLHMWIKDNF